MSVSMFHSLLKPDLLEMLSEGDCHGLGEFCNALHPAVVAEIERDSRFALRMLAGISRRLHGLVHDVQAYALHSGMQRVIGYLLREHQNDDTVSGEVYTVSLPVSKATIASRLSLTPEYFSKVLHELEAEKLIEIDKRDIRILDAQRLAKHPV